MTITEQIIQRSIILHLESRDWYVVKVVSASRAGIPDLICCTPKGVFVGIEVKKEYNKPSKLQEHNLGEIRKRKGVAFSCRSLEELKEYLKNGMENF